MALSFGLKKELDRGLELGHKLDLELIQQHKDACVLINSNNFDELHARFKWQHAVSDLIYKISVANGEPEAARIAAIQEACVMYQTKIAEWVCNLHETFDTSEMFDILINAVVQYQPSEDELYEIDRYIEENDKYDWNFNFEFKKEDGVLPVALKLEHLSKKSESVIIEARFDNAAVEDWLVGHTLVQDGHLVFVE
ncbi:MAG: hypothetical protein ACK5WS_04420 [Alphaproteobacteria bacterium]|jgi:hypothetical protein|nr:hypothetical protein [Candidatus Jidaibacter sp.]